MYRCLKNQIYFPGFMCFCSGYTKYNLYFKFPNDPKCFLNRSTSLTFIYALSAHPPFVHNFLFPFLLLSASLFLLLKQICFCHVSFEITCVVFLGDLLRHYRNGIGITCYFGGHQRWFSFACTRFYRLDNRHEQALNQTPCDNILWTRQRTFDERCRDFWWRFVGDW